MRTGVEVELLRRYDRQVQLEELEHYNLSILRLEGAGWFGQEDPILESEPWFRESRRLKDSDDNVRPAALIESGYEVRLRIMAGM